MKQIFSFLRFSKLKTKFSLILPLCVFAVIAGITVPFRLAGVPFFITAALCWIIAGGIVFAEVALIPSNSNLKRGEMLKYALGRFFYNIVVFVLIHIACSMALNIITLNIFNSLFSKLAYEHSPYWANVGTFLNQFTLYAVCLYAVGRANLYYGFQDTTHKRYNPHIIINSFVFAYIFLLPFVLDDCLYGEGMFGTAQFFLMQIAIDLKLGILPAIAAYLVTAVLTVFAMLCFYFEGRRNFYLKHPNEPEYDKPETDAFAEGS